MSEPVKHLQIEQFKSSFTSINDEQRTGIYGRWVIDATSSPKSHTDALIQTDRYINFKMVAEEVSVSAGTIVNTVHNKMQYKNFVRDGCQGNLWTTIKTRLRICEQLKAQCSVEEETFF